MTQNRSILIAAVLVLSSVAGLAETPDKHIRVIMDTSQSLRGNDPSGYVKLAAAMFYDLALGTRMQRDTFKLALFKPDWPDWEKTGKAPEPIPEKLILEPKLSSGGREEFIQKVLGMHYDARQTYFSPCFKWALDDLRASNTKITDNRVIVLITDGVPDWKGENSEDEKALKVLARQLHDEHIKVYVLAFSKEVTANKGWFDATLQFGPNGVMGSATERPDASTLLTDMLEIFDQSFGYTRESQGSSPTQIDIAANATLERAAVVALYPIEGNVGFELKPPSGPAVSQEQHEKASAEPNRNKGTEVRPVSYALKWIIPPVKGNYGFRSTGAAPSEVAILRPIKVDAVLRLSNGLPVKAVMADKPSEMEVLVRPTAAGSGDPGAGVRVGYYLRYFAQDDTTNPNLISEDTEGRITPEGRVFTIRPQFVRDPRGWPPGTEYPAFIEVVVLQNGVAVERAGALMQPVRVYPYISIRPAPEEQAAEAGGRELLRPADEGCVKFQFQGDRGGLGEKHYTMGVRLEPPLKLEGPFRGAKFRLDNIDLDDTGSRAGVWQAREPFEPSTLGSKDHYFCIVVGQPLREAMQTVTVHFGLQKDGDPLYEELNVVYPNLSVRINVAAPDFWHSLSSWLILLLSLLLTYLLFLFLKTRQTLAPDLAVSLGDRSPELTPGQLGELSILSRWFGFPHDRPVISLSGDKEIGSVRPLDSELFAFVPRGGFGNLCKEEGGEWRPLERREDGSWLVSAGEVYRAGAGEESRFFRLDYSSQRPRV